jgi:hypothetical protein
MLSREPAPMPDAVTSPQQRSRLRQLQRTTDALYEQLLDADTYLPIQATALRAARHLVLGHLMAMDEALHAWLYPRKE